MGDLFFTSFHFFQSHVATQELRSISSPPFGDRVPGLHIHVRTCNGACPSMGFDADRTKKRGKFYLKTTSKAPFCGKFSLKKTAPLFFGQFT